MLYTRYDYGNHLPGRDNGWMDGWARVAEGIACEPPHTNGFRSDPSEVIAANPDAANHYLMRGYYGTVRSAQIVSCPLMPRSSRNQGSW